MPIVAPWQTTFKMGAHSSYSVKQGKGLYWGTIGTPANKKRRVAGASCMPPLSERPNPMNRLRIVRSNPAKHL